MSPRPRNKKSRTLPDNLYFDDRHKTYHYRRPDTGKKTSMGKDRDAAIRAARTLNNMLAPGGDLVAKVMYGNPTMGEFLKVYLNEILPPRELAQATLDLYQVRCRQIDDAFGERAINMIPLRDIAVFLDSFPPRSSNQLRATLCDVFQQAAAKGYIEDNPAAVTIPKIEKKARKRHTLEGLMQIRSCSPPWLQNAIDLGLITAQRREDILAMKFEDVKDGYLHVVQKKTKRWSNAGYLRLKVTPQLQMVISRCRDSVPSPYLIHRRPDRLDSKQRQNKTHWTRIEERYLTRAFKEARDQAKAYPHLQPEEQPGFHQIRALSQHLYKKAGKDPQKIAGHANPSSTKNYLVGHDEIIWTEVDADLQIKGITP